MSSRNLSAPSTAEVNGSLWGARAEAWAEQEEQSGPMYDAAIRLARIRGGVHVLDVGCGAGSFGAAAAARGARVSGLDASDRLLEIARARVPDGDFRTGDLASLPFEDCTFDVVTGFNAFQFAESPTTALAEAGRVARPGGVVLAALWGRPERVELSVVMHAVSALAPASSSRSRSSLSEPGALESAVAEAGLQLEVSGVGTLAFEWADRETMLRGLTSAGGMVRISRAIGEEPLQAAVVSVMERFRTAGGGYRLQNEWRYALASP